MACSTAARSACGSVGTALYVAYVGYGDVGNTLLMVTGESKGAEWNTPERLDTTGRVFGHIPPVWYHGEFYWARLSSADTVEVCRIQPEGAEECVETSSPRISGLDVSDDGVFASLDAGTGDWVVESIAF